MTPKQVLESYAGPGKGMKVATWICAVLFVISVIAAIAVSSDNEIFIMLAIFTGVFWFAFGINNAVINSRLKKSIARLEQLGALEAAAFELNSPETFQHGKDNARLSNNFYFGSKSGTVLRYDDILLAYKFTQRTNFIVTEESLMLGTKTAGIVKATAMGRDKYKVVESAITVILQHNPQMLVGYTNDNLKAYRQTVKNIKNGIAN